MTKLHDTVACVDSHGTYYLSRFEVNVWNLQYFLTCILGVFFIWFNEQCWGKNKALRHFLEDFKACMETWE